MRTFTRLILSITTGVSLLSSAPSIPAQTTQEPTYLPGLQAWHFAEKPPLNIEFLQTADHEPRMIITNLHQYPLTSFIIRTDPTAPNKINNTLVYDGSARVGLLAPIPRGLSFVMGVPHQMGQTAPDPVLAAAVWEDGSTFGPEELLIRIPSARTVLVDTFDRAIDLLQSGLDKNWSAGEYIAAAQQLKLSSTANSVPVHAPLHTITTNMERMARENRSADVVTAMARNLLSLLKQDREALRQALGESTPPTGQAKNNP